MKSKHKRKRDIMSADSVTSTAHLIIETLVEVTMPESSIPKICSIAGCEIKHYTHGYCRKHERRIRLTGDKNGFVRGSRFVPIKDRLNSNWMPITETGCWIWMGSTMNKGYGVIRDKYKKKLTHRVSYEQNIGEIPEGLFVCHSCDTPSCINPNHLFLGTQSENMSDAVRKGRMQKGESRPNSKLTEEDIRNIRIDARTTVQIAEDYSVSRHLIGLIKRRKRWANVS